MTDANGNNSEDHTDWADVKLYGAIRDITRDNGKVKITAASMNSKLHAGETYQALLKANNESEQETNISSGLILYNTENQITNLTTKTTKKGLFSSHLRHFSIFHIAILTKRSTFDYC